MGKLTKQQYADLSADAYKNRTITTDDKGIPIGNHRYKVLAVSAPSKTGYHGTVYQDVRTNEIIIAHRGTELTSLKDIRTDLEMVLDKENRQEKEAAALTQKAIELSEKFHQKTPSLPAPQVSHTGHSLGGTLAQLMAHRFNHEGTTFNAYGAAGIGGIAEGGGRVTNYVKASDPVAAAAPHYGKVVVLATEGDIERLRIQGYSNSRNNPATRALLTAGQSAGAHFISNFTGPDSVLSERNYGRARGLAEQNGTMIRDYREDVRNTGVLFHGIKQQYDKGMEMHRKTRELIDKDPNLMSQNTQQHNPQQGIQTAAGGFDLLAGTNELIARLRAGDKQALTDFINLPQIQEAHRQSIAQAEQLLRQNPGLGEEMLPNRFYRPTFQEMPQQAQKLYHESREHLAAYYQERGIRYREEELENKAMALAAAGYAGRMPKVEMLNIKNGEIHIGVHAPDLRIASVNERQAAVTEQYESIAQAQQTQQAFEQQAQQRELERQMQGPSRGISIS